MIQNSQQLKREITANLDAVVEIATIAKNQNRPYTEIENRRVEALNAEIEKQKTELDAVMEKEEILKNKAFAIGNQILNNKMAESNGQTMSVQGKFSSKTVFATDQSAYDAGQFVMAVFGDSGKAFDYCRSNGLIQNAMKSSDNTKGGFLVPDPIADAVVELREQFGVFRQDSFLYPMTSGSALVPRVAGEVTSYYMGESDPSVSITSSDMVLNQIKLEAKKLATFTPMSSELDEDSAIPVAEMLARSIAWKFAYDEDNAGFNGDATSTYGGIVGLAGALQAGSKVTATGRQTFGALTMGDFEAVVGLAREWAGYNPSWYISKKGWANSMQRLLNAVGGNNIKDLAEGAPKMFLGYPVKIVQSLPSALTGTTGTPACYFGDLRLGSYFGTRRDIRVAVDSSYYFAQDCLAVRATERYDINVHDRGTATDAGGIIQLVFG
jgi:HK97 family phage major capsid protein